MKSAICTDCDMGVSEKKGVPYFGVLVIIRILLFGVHYSGPLFSETPISGGQELDNSVNNVYAGSHGSLWLCSWNDP